MNPDRLKELLQNGDDAPSAERGPACPDATVVAAYVDGTLLPDQCRDFESHLADCVACLTLVSLVSTDRDATPAAAVPFSLLARAEAGAAPPRRTGVRFRPSPFWAAAAMLVLVVPLLALLETPSRTGPAPQPVVRASRALASTTTAVDVVSPVAGATVRPDRLDVRWTGVTGSRYYDVRIVTDEGDVLVEQRVSGTDWPVPASAALEPGRDYYVQVDAYPTGAEPMSSEHVPFRVAD